MSVLQKPETHFPPPWQLKGEGIILLYRFPKKWINAHPLIPDYLKGGFKGGFGYLMMVNYYDSPVGPYKELLLIPGKFKPENRQSISHIIVNSESSTQNGRYNWGIPKITLPIIWESEKGLDTIGVGEEDEPLFFCKVSHKGIAFPVSTKILPLKLHQKWNRRSFHTEPKGSGWGKLAKIESLKINGKRFPDISQFKPLFGVKVSPFSIEFPAPSSITELQ
jgi:hypothetical protein